ncbi:MAG TPA: hypothetical protein VK934_05605 [Fimbriimonas sp.]|nr:hypothetical protein [Fimbriimonas sp.]
MAKTNRYKEAFSESYNMVGLAGAVALSAALLNPLPLIAALVAEAAYLLFVPDSKWYDQRLSTRYDQEVVDRRNRLKEQVFPTLSADTQARFTRLELVREQIASQTHEGKRWFREVLRKLDYLLEKFLLFAQKEVQFDRYLNTTLDEAEGIDPVPPIQVFDQKGRPKKRQSEDDPTRHKSLESKDAWIRSVVERVQECYGQELENIDKLYENSGEYLHNQAVLEKRKEVLMRRQQYIARIGETHINLGHQLALIQDTFGLINDEIRARSPEQVLADIEDVVHQTDTLTDVLETVAPFDSSPVERGAEKLFDVPNR